MSGWEEPRQVEESLPMVTPLKRIPIPEEPVCPLQHEAHAFLYILEHPFEYKPDTTDDGPNFKSYKHQQDMLLFSLTGLPKETHLVSGTYVRNYINYYSGGPSINHAFLHSLHIPYTARHVFVYNIFYNGLRNVVAGCVHNNTLLLWLQF